MCQHCDDDGPLVADGANDVGVVSAIINVCVVAAGVVVLCGVVDIDVDVAGDASVRFLICCCRR